MRKIWYEQKQIYMTQDYIHIHIIMYIYVYLYIFLNKGGYHTSGGWGRGASGHWIIFTLDHIYHSLHSFRKPLAVLSPAKFEIREHDGIENPLAFSRVNISFDTLKPFQQT